MMMIGKPIAIPDPPPAQSSDLKVHTI